MALKSQLFRGDAKLEAAAVAAPAHIVPGASGDHVRKIQIALNLVDNAGLDTDGIYGPRTADAVLAYKQKRQIINRSYQSQADNIVGVMTMAALDAEVAASEGGSDGDTPLTSQGPDGACDVAEAQGARGAADLQPASPQTVAAALALVPKVRLVIKGTRRLLTAASPFVQPNVKLTIPTGAVHILARKGIGLLIDIFSLDKHKNPVPGFENIRRVYKNMDVAFNRSFETDPLIAPVLFVANTHISMEVDLAYTAAGGAFLSSRDKLKGLGDPTNQIYVCNNLLTESELQQISV